MKNKLTIKQRIKTCFKLLFGKNTLSYIIDLEQRCENINFAPYDDRVKTKYNYFVWDSHTIELAENWIKQHHTETNN